MSKSLDTMAPKAVCGTYWSPNFCSRLYIFYKTWHFEASLQHNENKHQGNTPGLMVSYQSRHVNRHTKKPHMAQVFLCWMDTFQVTHKLQLSNVNWTVEVLPAVQWQISAILVT